MDLFSVSGAAQGPGESLILPKEVNEVLAFGTIIASLMWLLCPSPFLSLSPHLQVWLPAQRGKGMEISGTFVRRDGQIYADLTFSNRALQPIENFTIQFNKSRCIDEPVHGRTGTESPLDDRTAMLYYLFTPSLPPSLHPSIPLSLPLSSS